MKYGITKIIFFISVMLAGYCYSDEAVKYVPIINSDLTVIIPIEPNHLPPDPGQDANITMEGVDSNANGVRDDVERYIAYTYPGENNGILRDRLKNFAYWQQKTIILGESVSEANAVKIIEAGYCIQNLLGKDEGHDSYAEIIARHLNTYDRSMRYIAYLDKVQSLSWGANASTNPDCNL